MNNSLLSCRVPRGYRITYDMTMEGANTLKKVRKWLEQGYAQGRSGNALDVYNHFADMYGYPYAYVGAKHCQWRCSRETLQRLATDTVERAKVVERLMPLADAASNAHSYWLERHKDGKWLLDFWGGNGNHRGGNKKEWQTIMKVLLSDPYLVELRRKAVAAFDSTNVIVRSSESCVC